MYNFLMLCEAGIFFAAPAPAPAPGFFLERLQLQGAKNIRLRLHSPEYRYQILGGREEYEYDRESTWKFFKLTTSTIYCLSI